MDRNTAGQYILVYWLVFYGILYKTSLVYWLVFYGILYKESRYNLVYWLVLRMQNGNSLTQCISAMTLVMANIMKKWMVM